MVLFLLFWPPTLFTGSNGRIDHLILSICWSLIGCHKSNMSVCCVMFLHIALEAVNQVNAEFLCGIKEHGVIAFIMRIHI